MVLSLLPDKLNPIDNLICFELIAEKEFLKIISSLNPKKSAKWDEVSPYLLKRSAHVVVKLITNLINLSLKQVFCPKLLK